MTEVETMFGDSLLLSIIYCAVAATSFWKYKFWPKGKFSYFKDITYRDKIGKVVECLNNCLIKYIKI